MGFSIRPSSCATRARRRVVPDTYSSQNTTAGTSRQEHRLRSSQSASFIDAYRSGETGSAIVGKCEVYSRLILCPCEPRYDRALSIGVEMRAVHGTTREMPIVRVGNMGLRPAAINISEQRDITDIFRSVTSVRGN